MTTTSLDPELAAISRAPDRSTKPLGPREEPMDRLPAAISRAPDRSTKPYAPGEVTVQLAAISRAPDRSTKAGS